MQIDIQNKLQQSFWFLVAFLIFALCLIILLIFYIIYKNVTKNRGNIKVSKNGVEIDTANDCISKDKLIIIVESVKEYTERMLKIKYYGILEEQMKIVRKLNKIMLNSMFQTVCSESDIPEASEEWNLIETVYNKVYDFSIGEIEKIFRENHFLDKSEYEWVDYKKIQSDYILQTVFRYLDWVCGHMKDGKEVRLKIVNARSKTLKIYNDYIDQMFEIAKEISIKKDTEIKEIEKDIDNIKNGGLL